jgi:hypothetical protein
LSQPTISQLVSELEKVHYDLGRITADQLMGIPAAVNTMDILESHPQLLRPKTLGLLRKSINAAEDPEVAERIQRVMFACMDLMIEEETASLSDMLRFYMERGRMIVPPEKIPALEVVPWLQSQSDFSKREEMEKENSIFLKGIVNPMLLGITELTIRAVKEKFGYANYADFCSAKKRKDFAAKKQELQLYLERTESSYYERIVPWAEETIGREFKNLSRYHALYLLRISKFDRYFPSESLVDVIAQTFELLNFDVRSNPGLVVDVSDSPSKTPTGMCVGVQIPGEVYVVMKPTGGGLIDVETLLHETGHAFFLSNFDPNLPVEYRRLYASADLDETFAFLFWDLIGNPSWLSKIGRVPDSDVSELMRLFENKKLCLIRRHIGKFLAECDFYEKSDIKDSSFYREHLHAATGFSYEAVGYLIDSEPDFYTLDYVDAWAGAHTLGNYLEFEFGQDWFQNRLAGDFLRSIATEGRRNSMHSAIRKYCGKDPVLPF